MAAVITGLISAICAACLAGLSGHGFAMIFLAYTLGGVAGLLLGAWRMVIVAEAKENASSTNVNKAFLAKKDKTVRR